MPNKLTFIYAKYKRVSGFTPGPLKPTVTTTFEATPSDVIDFITNNISSDALSLAKGESVNIVLTAGDPVT